MSTLDALRHPPMLPASECNSLLANLPAPQIALLAPFLQDVVLATDSILYEADDPIDFVYFPHSAVVSRIEAFESGECVVSALTGRESACGVGVTLGRPCALNRAVVLISGTAARIAAADFQTVCLKKQYAATDCDVLQLAPDQPAAPIGGVQRLSYSRKAAFPMVAGMQ